MRRPTQSYSRAQLEAAYRQERRLILLISGICIAVSLAALAVFFFRGGY
jgi:hypothetical protein